MSFLEDWPFLVVGFIVFGAQVLWWHLRQPKGQNAHDKDKNEAGR